MGRVGSAGDLDVFLATTLFADCFTKKSQTQCQYIVARLDAIHKRLGN